MNQSEVKNYLYRLFQSQNFEDFYNGPMTDQTKGNFIPDTLQEKENKEIVDEYLEIVAGKIISAHQKDLDRPEIFKFCDDDGKGYGVEIPKNFMVINWGSVEKGDWIYNIHEGFKEATESEIGYDRDNYYLVICEKENNK